MKRRLRSLLSRLTYRLPPRQGLFIFAWHNIGYGHPLLDGDRLEVEPEQFRQEIEWIRRHFSVLSCGAAHASLQRGKHSGRFAVLTFDDGYRGVLDYAAPILNGLPFTVFVNSWVVRGATGGWTNGGGMPWRTMAISLDRWAKPPLTDDERQWVRSFKQRFSVENVRALTRLFYDRAPAPDPDLYLDAAALTTLTRTSNARIANHTARHYVLSRVTDDVVRAEIREGREYSNSPWLAIPHGEMEHMPRNRTLIAEAGYAPLLAVGGPHRPGERSEIGRRIVVSKRRPVWLATWLAGRGR